MKNMARKIKYILNFFILDLRILISNRLNDKKSTLDPITSLGRYVYVSNICIDICEVESFEYFITKIAVFFKGRNNFFVKFT